MEKFWTTALFLVFSLIIGLFGFFIYKFAFNSQNKAIAILSPIPDFLTILSNKQVSTLNLSDLDFNDELKSAVKKPEITADSALIYDTTSKQVLYAKNPKEKLPMASLTKIMTAIIALENKKNDDKYIVSKEDLVGENTMGLDNGEMLSLEDLLYGLMLHSGNDAAETLANNFKEGGRNAFIKAMNDKAKSLNINDTNFTNPTGLEGDGIQYTTSYDLIVITNYALSNFPVFSKVVSTFDYNISKTSTHKEFFLENETNLLTSYPGVKGVKTGYTPEAGLCLVTYLDYNGHKIIGVVLNSQNRRDDMKDLLDYSLESLGISPPPHS